MSGSHPAQAAFIGSLLLFLVQSTVALVVWGAEHGVTFLLHPLSASVAHNRPPQPNFLTCSWNCFEFVLAITNHNSLSLTVLSVWL